LADVFELELPALPEPSPLEDVEDDTAAAVASLRFGDSFEVDAPSDDPPSDEPLPPEESALEPEAASPVAFEAPAPDVARRSFLAQPDPLKWIAGVANAFLMGPPPHSGQAAGGSAWTPRRISNRWPQFAQS
jgi:hypothetical protein